MSNVESKYALVTLESLSCGGKTNMLNKIAADQRYEKVIKSIIISTPRHMENPTPVFFMQNDEEKFAAAEIARKQGYEIAVMDRGWLATLIFYTVMESINDNFPKGIVLNWVVESIGKTISLPDYFVYIDIPPEESVRRARENGRSFAAHNMWMMYPEKMRDAYEEFWRKPDQRIIDRSGKELKLLRVNGGLPMDQVSNQIQSLLDQIVYNPRV